MPARSHVTQEMRSEMHGSVQQGGPRAYSVDNLVMLSSSGTTSHDLAAEAATVAAVAHAVLRRMRGVGVGMVLLLLLERRRERGAEGSDVARRPRVGRLARMQSRRHVASRLKRHTASTAVLLVPAFDVNGLERMSEKVQMIERVKHAS